MTGKERAHQTDPYSPKSYHVWNNNQQKGKAFIDLFVYCSLFEVTTTSWTLVQQSRATFTT